MGTRPTMGEVVRAHGTERPSGLAAAEGDLGLTWAELDRAGDRLAASLRADGIGPGDRVLWLGQNSIRLWELMVGAAPGGRVPLSGQLAPAAR